MIAFESIVLAIIGIADLVTTVLWVQHHGAQEANPVFAHYLAMGVVWFSLMKLVLLVAPIFLLEWARRRRPTFTRRASRFAIAAYLAMYGIGFARLNPDLLQFRPTAASADVMDVKTMGHFSHMSPEWIHRVRMYFLKRHRPMPAVLKHLVNQRTALL